MPFVSSRYKLQYLDCVWASTSNYYFSIAVCYEHCKNVLRVAQVVCRLRISAACVVTKFSTGV